VEEGRLTRKGGGWGFEQLKAERGGWGFGSIRVLCPGNWKLNILLFDHLLNLKIIMLIKKERFKK
jgi:hypothetical protein